MSETVRIFFVSAIPEFGDGTRARVAIVRTGTFRYRGKDITLTVKDFEDMAKNLREYRAGELAFDYDHGTAVGETIDERMAAGWKPKDAPLEIEKYADQEGGILWSVVDLTPRAADYARNKEIRFCSAEFSKHYFHPEAKKDVGTYLHAVALTNRPFQEKLPGLVLMSEQAAALCEAMRSEASEGRVVVGKAGKRFYGAGE